MKIRSKSLLNKIEKILQSEKLSGFRASQEYHLGGENVQLLEEQFRRYFDVRYAISLNSATAALHCALVACGIGKGDKVIVTPYSFVSSASCVLMAGAEPVFVDVNPDTFCIDCWLSEIQYRANAAIPVHLMGHPANLPFNVGEVKIIEDVAQAIGATNHGKKMGTIGDCGIFSFNQSKHINTGEGGMLITNDDKIAEIVRAMRNHAEVSCPDMKLLGYNYRMTEIQAIIAIDQFERLEEDIEGRIELCNYMTERLNGIDGLTPPVVYPDCRHVYYTYGVKVDKDKLGMHRDQLQEGLMKRGIYFGKGYVKPLHLLPIFGGHEG